MNSINGHVWKRRSTEISNDDDKSNLVITKKIKIKNTKKKKKKTVSHKTQTEYRLLRFEELPEYMKDNEFILNYYRADWPLKQALVSLLRWHNETLNVWTHLIGFVVFLGLTITNLMHVPQVSDFLNLLTWSFPLNSDGNVSHNSLMNTPKLIDLKHESPVDMETGPPLMAITRWPFFVFQGGSMFCLLSSTSCHLFSCHSHCLNLVLLQMDYAGITAMIITSFFPPIYYIFQCEPMWQFVYLGGITVMGVFTIVTLLSPSLSSGKFRSFKAFLFMGMGLFGLIPAVHAIMVNWHEPQRNGILAYETLMAVSYLTGTMFYITRIPERWKPGWFDLVGHSHQIFHCFVIMGAIAHYGAALMFLEFRSRVGC
ncbi:heptahelical transmembrane protein 1-like [Bidens hawaiensis]|uniref:heptahelical transmembrane protein 1-like n=1 Tax=Bidens hawaiensis TaxID=980011 RepID=UPI00404A12D7